MPLQRVLVPAVLEQRDGSLWSANYGDRYHSRSGAIAERERVFINASELARRSSSCGGRLIVAEMGFGAGANFALAWREWRKASPPGALLHYISWENQPLRKEEIEGFLAKHGLAQQGSRIAKALPQLWPGWHRVWLEPDVCLTLVYADAASAAEAEFAADIWFLDGFSPKTNPEMWSLELMEQVFRLTSPGGVACTYSSAAAVRHALGAAGFEVEKVSGFASKREITVARRSGTRPMPAVSPKQIGIVGAGVAAGFLRSALGRRGFNPKMVFPIDQSGSASTNPGVLLTPRPTVEKRALGEVVTSCFAYASRELADSCESCGALLLAHSEREKKRQLRIAQQQWPADLCQALDETEANDSAGIKHGMSGLLLPLALRADGGALVRGLLDGADHIDAAAVSLRPRPEGGWLLETTAGGIEFDALVLACGASLGEIASDGFGSISIRIHSGRMLAFPASAASSKLRLPLLYGGSIFPAAHGVHLSVEGKSMPAALAELLDGRRGRTVWEGRRVKLRDHLPLAGMLGDGLGALGALGARGFAQAPLLAEHVVCSILGEPSPLSAPLSASVAPAPRRRQW